MSERVCSTCGTGRVQYISAGLCRPCYMHARYQATYVPKPRPLQCTYLAAHHRVYVAKGKADTYTCTCGQPAEEWAYQGGAPSEQRGVRIHYRRGQRVEVHTVWSGDPAYYMAMCKRCHLARDQGRA